MRYEKAETVLRVALDMQASALGLSLEELQRNYSDKPLSRRTAERLRDAIERLFPQIEQANPGEVPKRWRLPGGTVNGLASVTAAELADLSTAISLLRRENMDVQAENAERGVAKMRALVKRPVMNRIEPDLEALTEAEGLAMRPGPRPKIAPEIVSALREAIITRHKVKLHYLYRGTGRRGFHDGPGPPVRCEAAKSKGLGLKLVLWLVKQIDGDLKVIPRANGSRACVTVIFCSPRLGTDETTPVEA
jgi:predicted DNA-binding transcriptional regulator YafY